MHYNKVNQPIHKKGEIFQTSGWKSVTISHSTWRWPSSLWIAQRSPHAARSRLVIGDTGKWGEENSWEFLSHCQAYIKGWRLRFHSPFFPSMWLGMKTVNSYFRRIVNDFGIQKHLKKISFGTWTPQKNIPKNMAPSVLGPSLRHLRKLTLRESHLCTSLALVISQLSPLKGDIPNKYPLCRVYMKECCGGPVKAEHITWVLRKDHLPTQSNDGDIDFWNKLE